MKVRNLRKETKRQTGPGTLTARFKWIMDQLEKEWPNPEPFSSSFCAEKYYIKFMKLELHSKTTEIDVLRKALSDSIQGLNDWTATYASEHCSDEMVEAAQNRLHECGTIAYIADLVKVGNDALKGKYDTDPN